LSCHYIPEQFKLEKIPYTALTTPACPYPGVFVTERKNDASRNGVPELFSWH
jgi:hypothetical protein